MSSHWHYATSMPARHDPSVIETMVSAETDLGKTAAKQVLEPMIRHVQGSARYQDPEDASRLWEPADWWMLSDELVWLTLPSAAGVVFAVYPCSGDCTASGVRHRDELADQLRASGACVDVQIQSANLLPGYTPLTLRSRTSTFRRSRKPSCASL